MDSEKEPRQFLVSEYNGILIITSEYYSLTTVIIQGSRCKRCDTPLETGSNWNGIRQVLKSKYNVYFCIRCAQNHIRLNGSRSSQNAGDKLRNKKAWRFKNSAKDNETFDEFLSRTRQEPFRMVAQDRKISLLRVETRIK